jgi:hypothetical protein
VKKLLLVLNFILLTLLSFGQTRKDECLKLLEKITSRDKAEALIAKDSTLKGAIKELYELPDTTLFYKYLFTKKPGYVEVFETKGHTDDYIIKILSNETVVNYRVNYIYLNNWKCSKNKIDSLRLVIYEKIKQGNDFNELVMEYSMDGSAKRGGDTGWFEKKQMVRTFESAVKNHKTGDIYSVDIPKYKWYYIVKNTYEPIKCTKLTVILLPI